MNEPKMAVCNDSGSILGSKLHIHSMQTVMPMNPTDPKISLPVLAGENLGSGIYKRCFNIVLCYKKNSDEEDSASLVAGWIKESLGRALSEQPMLAGRLRRKDGVGEGLEIVSNDSGVRLIEAQFAMTLQEFLDLEDKKEAESQLVFWEDIDYEQNPQFSPLFYIQVSNFKCGGYAIGISISLLLIDPFAMTNFLKKWTGIHLEMVSKTDAELPIFYRQRFGNNGSSLALPINSTTKAGAAESMIFEIPSKILNLDKEIHKNIAAQCIDESEQKLKLKTASKVSMVIKEPSEDVIKVQNFAREELIQKPSSTVNGITYSSKWDHLGTDQLCFSRGNNPAHVSCWINSVLDEAFVMIFPSQGNNSAGLKIIVTFPI